MAAAAILKIAFLAITHRPIVRCQRIFVWGSRTGMSTWAKWQNLQIFKIQDGERPPFWKSLNRHISVKNRLILMKFGTLHQILNPITVTWPKIHFFKTWKSLFWSWLIDRLSDFSEILYDKAEPYVGEGCSKNYNFF